MFGGVVFGHRPLGGERSAMKLCYNWVLLAGQIYRYSTLQIH